MRGTDGVGRSKLSIVISTGLIVGNAKWSHSLVSAVLWVLPTGSAPAVAPAAPAVQQPQEEGWSTFEEPGVSTTPAPEVSTSSSASGAFHGWQAFDTPQLPTPPSSTVPEPPSPHGPVMKELPSVSTTALRQM